VEDTGGGRQEHSWECPDKGHSFLQRKRGKSEARMEKKKSKVWWNEKVRKTPLDQKHAEDEGTGAENHLCHDRHFQQGGAAGGALDEGSPTGGENHEKRSSGNLWSRRQEKMNYTRELRSRGEK